jgi:N-acetylmuramoyl-L-alanine amidase
MKMKWIPSPNRDTRKSGVVDTIVLHYTALPLDDTIARFLDKRSEVSAHYVIDRDGTVIQMVRLKERAWHAGASTLGDRQDVNDFSIGIELVNWGNLKKIGDAFYTCKEDWTHAYSGEEPVFADSEHWEPYSEAQYDALVQLVTLLHEDFPAISRETVVGHSDVCLPEGRKIDPGGAFDLRRVLDRAFG